MNEPQNLVVRALCTCRDDMEYGNPTGHDGNCPRGFQIWRSQQESAASMQKPEEK